VKPAYIGKSKVFDVIEMPERVPIELVMEFSSECADWGIYREPF
jgi:hypothetical protein